MGFGVQGYTLYIHFCWRAPNVCMIFKPPEITQFSVLILQPKGQTLRSGYHGHRDRRFSPSPNPLLTSSSHGHKHGSDDEEHDDVGAFAKYTPPRERGNEEVHIPLKTESSENYPGNVGDVPSILVCLIGLNKYYSSLLAISVELAPGWTTFSISSPVANNKPIGGYPFLPAIYTNEPATPEFNAM